MLRIQAFTFNPFEENTYVVFDETGDAAIIDPGCSNREEESELRSFIEKEKLHVRLLLNTHGHIDHVLGNHWVKATYNPPFYIHPIELPVLKSVKAYASTYGFAGYTEVLPDGALAEDKPVVVGKASLRVLFVPGHSPGHVAFFQPEQKILIVGDVLFHRSVGRTDLPGGNTDTLLNSIHQKLFILPNDVVVYPGHGPTTTIGEEKVSNPYCALSV